MLTRVMHKIGSGLTVILLATALVSGPALAKPLPPAAGGQVARPASAPLAAPVTIELCAEASTGPLDGELTMPDGAAIQIWGFSLKGIDCNDTVSVPSLPGPQLVVNAGEVVTVNLTNYLTENLSIAFPGQSLVPDMVGAPACTGVGCGSASTCAGCTPGTVSYLFTAANLGTYLYEAGTNTAGAGQARWQVPMGLYGALIVRPATPLQAYNSVATAYDVEATLVLSEIDPALNNYVGGPSGFFSFPTPTNPDITPAYLPKYWLINGLAYPSPAAISATAGPRLLLRYLNAGLVHHTMTLLGTHQRVIAKEAFELDDVTRFQYQVVAETIPSGQTLDTIATIPAGAASGAKFPLYNRQLHLTNGLVVGSGTVAPHFPGGMLTFITVP